MSSHLIDGFDPTGLADVRARIERETTRRWTKTAREVKRAIVADDALRIGPKAPRMAQPIADKASMFKRWLDERLLLGIVGHDAGWIKPHVDAASARAYRRSVADQANLGFIVPGAAPSAGVCHAASVSHLADICGDVSERAHASVSAGLLSQARPAQIARGLDQAFGRGLQRSRVLAEHSITMAFTQGVLDRFEAAGITHVGTLSESAARSGAAWHAQARLGSHGMGGAASADMADAAASDADISDEMRFTPQPQHPRTGRYAPEHVVARETRRHPRTGRFRAQGISLAERRKEERAEARFAKVKGRLDVVTAGDDRVCDVCDEISENGPYAIGKARSLIPAHPHCRCIFIAAGSMALDAGIERIVV